MNIFWNVIEMDFEIDHIEIDHSLKSNVFFLPTVEQFWKEYVVILSINVNWGSGV